MAQDRPVKLIVMDVDGTLVDDQKQLPDVNRRALQAAVDAGLHIAIGSGRMTNEELYLLKQLADTLETDSLPSFPALNNPTAN